MLHDGVLQQLSKEFNPKSAPNPDIQQCINNTKPTLTTPTQQVMGAGPGGVYGFPPLSGCPAAP